MSTILAMALLLSAFFISSKIIYRPEYIIVVILSLLSIITVGRKSLSCIGKELTLLYIMIVFAAISLIAQVIVGNSFIPRDYMILLRYLVYSLALIAGTFVSIRTKREWILKYSLLIIIISSIAISFMQYFNVSGINQFMVPIYCDRYQSLIAGMSWRRIIGTIGNANYWGLLMALFFVGSTYYAIIKRKLTSLPFVVLLLISILMTGSRSALLVAAASPVIGLVMIGTKGQNLSQKKILTFIALIIATTFIYFSYKIFISEYYENKDRFDMSNTQTLEMRVKYWSESLSEIIANPYQMIVGRGPSKSSQRVYGDNIYVLIFRDFGLISIIVYLLFLLTLFRRLLLQIKLQPPDMVDRYSIGLFVFISIVIFDLAADTWFNVRLSIPLLFGYGYLMANETNETIESQIKGTF